MGTISYGSTRVRQAQREQSMVSNKIELTELSPTIRRTAADLLEKLNDGATGDPWILVRVNGVYSEYKVRTGDVRPLTPWYLSG